MASFSLQVWLKCFPMVTNYEQQVSFMKNSSFATTQIKCLNATLCVCDHDVLSWIYSWKDRGVDVNNFWSIILKPSNKMGGVSNCPVTLVLSTKGYLCATTIITKWTWHIHLFYSNKHFIWKQNISLYRISTDRMYFRFFTFKNEQQCWCGIPIYITKTTERRFFQ